ncbi:nitroreductase family protein [Hoyosella subflava]|uniref:Nitroreductase family protein n=1 Tax=Hoyosella subflava (strain DSM 45089 / JCM 17490 / NBRC 109087 / DQS3-9A1) TaxID=443218 RepID=F6EEW3_HOYSD|nr:nitroreductase family protein [Hoyosella subflava]AEF40913.1 nitroreductase family protein [Hoyosella subflava DQS3-9A1]
MDIRSVDELLSTTRAVRKRLDLERPVPGEVIEECLQLAVQAPTGTNAQGWRFLVVTDADKRAALAEMYRRGWERYYGDADRQIASVPERFQEQQRRLVSSGQFLADNMHRVPVHVVPCVLSPRDGVDTTFLQASLYGSVFPAVWSFQLALRSRGLGSVLTTLHLLEEDAAADVLGLPANVKQAALLPVAYTKGTDFRPATRRPVQEITYWNSWKSPRLE